MLLLHATVSIRITVSTYSILGSFLGMLDRKTEREVGKKSTVREGDN